MYSRNNPRKSTTKLMDMMDEGVLDPREVADMCLNWLSEAEVDDMARRNDIEGFRGEDEDDEDDDDTYPGTDFD